MYSIIPYINIWRHVFLHLVLDFLVEVRLLDFNVSAIFERAIEAICLMK